MSPQSRNHGCGERYQREISHPCEDVSWTSKCTVEDLGLVITNCFYLLQIIYLKKTNFFKSHA